MKIRFTLYIIAFVLSQTLVGCAELEYDGKTRIVYEGRVTDDEGQPLDNIPVNVLVQGNSDRDIIAYTSTDGNGYYRLIFPNPMNSKNVLLQINQGNEGFSPRTAYSQLSFVGLKDDDLVDYKITFDDVKLYKTVDSVQLAVNFVGDGSAHVDKAQLLGLVDDNLLNYNFSLPEQDTEPAYEDFETVHFVRKNQVATLIYIVYDPFSTTVYTIEEREIVVGEEDLTVTINI